ncbi:MAG: tRNA pseudouridine(38-40) synthase TruA [Bacteroidales bacterium]|nr:tRNA pseudouridine(38-40) synthase TruA [Bacteroidales bacterium]
MRYFLCLSYDGSAFSGWQIQRGVPSVQACLEAALARLLGRGVAVTGAGRTDAAVNASGYVAHFDWEGELPFEASDFTYKLNAILPREMAVHSVAPVADDLHARFSARRREYTYFIHRQKDPFVRNFSWHCGYPEMDFEAMNKACQYLLGTHDFTCFEKSGSDNKTSICTVCEAFWKPYVPSHLQVMGAPEGGGILPPSGAYWYFRISADRFLRNMVRATVGSLIEVGRGKRSPEWIAQLVAGGTRSDAGESVPGHALFLNRVSY